MAMVVAVGFSYGEVSYVVTALWALMAVVTLAWGVIRDVAHLRWLGMAAVMASVLKLVFFDLNQADTLWRVAIFVGLGGALLVISYFSPEGDGPSRGEELEVEEM